MGSTDRKIVQIGFNKCGTRSLYSFFMQNDVPAMHWKRGLNHQELPMKGLVGRDMMINLTTGNRPFEGHEEYTFYSDLMGPPGLPIFEGHFYFKEIFNAYPDSVFILNIRDKDRWLKSRVNHGDFVARFRSHYKLENENEVIDLWSRQWDAHMSGVKDFFSDKPGSLLIFELENHDGAFLAEKLSHLFQLDPEKWEHKGKTLIKDKETAP